MNVTIKSQNQGIDESGKRTRTVTYQVIAASPDQAETAPGVARFGSSYGVSDPQLFCTSVSVNTETGQTNTNVYNVVCTFTRRAGGPPQVEPTNPASQPTLWTFGLGLTSESFDQDVDQKPIQNSARDRFNQTFNKLTPSLTFTARKWVSGAQVATKLQQVEAFLGCVNSSTFKDREAGTVLFLGGGPVGELPENPVPTAFYEFSYNFEFRADGWKLRVCDEGYNIYNKNFGAGATYDQNRLKYIPANPDRLMVKLNGKGSTFGNKTTTGEGPLDNAEVEETAYAIFLKFTIYESKNFSEFGL